MSSISSNSSNPDKIREYYTRRENEIEDHYKSEIENLRKSQSEDTERIRTEAGEQFETFKTRMHEKLTDQDKKHQADIEALKSLYQKKIEDLTRKREA